MIWTLWLACGGPATAPEVVADVRDPVAAAGACDVAWRELAEARDGLVAAGATPRAPTAERFRQACERLPTAARPCLAPSGFLAAPDVCRAALDAVDPVERRRIDALLRSP